MPIPKANDKNYTLMHQFIERNSIKKFPWSIFFIAIFIWLVLAGANFYYQHFHDGYTGTGILFPFSVIYPNAFLWSSFFFATAFLVCGIFSLKFLDKMNVFVLTIFCFFLVVLGNLSQGSFSIGFMEPIYLKGRQYYTDAIAITNGDLWLKDFSKNIETFQLHTKTHPPFTTLLHYWILQASGGSIASVAIVFSVLGGLSLPLFYKSMLNLNIAKVKAKQLLLLFAVIPSVNIYLFVSIDALVLTSTLIFILGITRFINRKKIDFLSVFYTILGLFFTNMLSFSGLFLFAVLGLITLYFLFKRKYDFFIFSLICGASFLIGLILLFVFTSYNHYEVFLLASHSENPNGFRLLHQPLIYFFTRIENIAEILLFLSFGFIAVLFSNKNKLTSDDESVKIISISGILALAVMFLTGAYGTGETARACLYIVPFFVLLLKNITSENFSILYVLCLFQTFGMQMIGNFFW